jgi:hypothetical protein
VLSLAANLQTSSHSRRAGGWGFYEEMSQWRMQTLNKCVGKYVVIGVKNKHSIPVECNADQISTRGETNVDQDS